MQELENSTIMPYSKGAHESIGEAQKAATDCLFCNVHFCATAPLTRHLKDRKAPGMENKTGCPITDIREMNFSLSQGKFEEAWWHLMWNNPLFGVTGTACSAPCHSDCISQEVSPVYSKVDGEGKPVEIRKNEMAAYEYGVAQGFADEYIKKVKAVTKVGLKARIVGGGPGGKAAAHFFHREGWDVEIISAEPNGLLSVIPNDHLPETVVNECNRQLEALGTKVRQARVVESKTKSHKDDAVMTISELTKNCDAVMLVTGASKPRELEVSGADLEGVIPAIPFLRGKKLEEQGLPNPFPKLRKIEGREPNVLVVGAGDTADDAVRSVKHLSQSLQLADLLVRSEIPESYQPSWGTPRHPKYWIIGNNDIQNVHRGVVSELKGNEKDELTHAVLKGLDGELTTVPVDNVIVAIGSEVDPHPWEKMGVELEKGKIKVDANGFTGVEFNRKRIYAAGDATDREILPHAIESSIQTAKAIIEYFRG